MLEALGVAAALRRRRRSARLLGCATPGLDRRPGADGSAGCTRRTAGPRAGRGARASCDALAGRAASTASTGCCAADGSVVVVLGARHARLRRRRAAAVLAVGVLVDITARLRAVDERARPSARCAPLATRSARSVLDGAPGAPLRSCSTPRARSCSCFNQPGREVLEDRGFWALASASRADREVAILAEDERTSMAGEGFDAEYRMIAADGRVLWLSASATRSCATRTGQRQLFACRARAAATSDGAQAGRRPPRHDRRSRRCAPRRRRCAGWRSPTR